MTKSRKAICRLVPLGLLICAVLGCKLLQSIGGPTVLKSADGKFQITVPRGWRENAGLHSTAGIKATYPRREMNVLVFTRAKADFDDDVTLDKYTELTAINQNLGSPEATPPIPVKINGLNGRQYLVQGITEDLHLAYLITTVETREHYHRIVTWTLRSRISENQPMLEQVTNSFRDLSAPVEIGSPP